MADLHQPLHVAYKDNKFGSEVSVVFLGKPTNLQQVWDSEILAKHSVSWRELGRKLRNEVTKTQRDSWRESTPLDWAKESLKISRTNALGYPRSASIVLGHSYFRDGADSVLRRLTQAGVRLGNTLNGLLG